MGAVRMPRRAAHKASWPARYRCPVRASAKVDHAIRAMLELAAAGSLVKGERVATAQGIPQKFLENIMLDLRHAGLVHSQRGVEGGYALARPAAEISLADVIRAVEGPIARLCAASARTTSCTRVWPSGCATQRRS